MSGASALRVKVCGLTDETDLGVAVEAGADAVGIVADVPVDTPREVPAARARELADAVPPFVTSVLVTMPGSVAECAELAKRVGTDAVQVHGDLTPAEVEALGGSFDGDVLVATDHRTAAEYAAVADGLVVDSVDDSGAGGTGETHDWERTREVVRDLDVPVVLAGGLIPSNVAEAVRTVRPFAVDVASGVEGEVPGRKDHDAVRGFVRRAKRAGERADEGVTAEP
ncbi:phosphoribosylanthranilate isomerase [Salinirubellus sp. GCM10025818]|uniref:phosphoribosylanthranilate isomerase n=1 Tax=Salinirubellus TaxID=2162630 RepID=UPI0030CA6AA5